MLRYVICSSQSPDSPQFAAKKTWIEELFSYIEKNNLEDSIINTMLGERTVICSGTDKDGYTHDQFFTCTGKNKGQFIQRITEPSGLRMHDRSLEFEFKVE